jgi:large subunit ribosomal protein L22
MKTQAVAKYLKISPRKLRLSADLVRGRRIVEAENILAATPKKGAVMVSDALKSAVANAENNHNLRKNSLAIAEIRVDEGPKLKRFRPRSRGSASPILHRMAHLTVIVSDDAPVEKKTKKFVKKAEAKPVADKPVAKTEKSVEKKEAK